MPAAFRHMRHGNFTPAKLIRGHLHCGRGGGDEGVLGFHDDRSATGVTVLPVVVLFSVHTRVPWRRGRCWTWATEP